MTDRKRSFEGAIVPEGRCSRKCNATTVPLYNPPAPAPDAHPILLRVPHAAERGARVILRVPSAWLCITLSTLSTLPAGVSCSISPIARADGAIYIVACARHNNIPKLSLCPAKIQRARYNACGRWTVSLPDTRELSWISFARSREYFPLRDIGTTSHLLPFSLSSVSAWCQPRYIAVCRLS